MKPIQTYQATGIMVTFDPNLCIHSAVCLKSLPAVFDIGRNPWIQADAATVEQIVATIDQCPSRALKYVLDAEVALAEKREHEPALATTSIQLAQNGPLLVKGRFVVLDEQGVEIDTRETAALCRCGATKTPPFCDGSHLTSGFAPRQKK